MQIININENVVKALKINFSENFFFWCHVVLVYKPHKKSKITFSLNFQNSSDK